MGGAKSKYIATSELYAATDSGKAPPVVDARRAGFRCRFPAHYISAWHRDRRTSQPVIGDFALRPNEVNPVVQALRNGIEVTALYQRMRNGVLPLFLNAFVGKRRRREAKGFAGRPRPKQCRAQLNRTRSRRAGVA